MEKFVKGLSADIKTATEGVAMEKFVKVFSADIKTATEEGRKKLIAAVSAMKTRRPKMALKKPKVFKHKKSNKSSKSDEASSKRTNEIEDMIQIDDVESPPSVYLRIDSPDDDGVNLEPSEQQINEDGLSPEDTITVGIIDPNSEVGTSSSLSEEPRSVDVAELKDAEKNSPEKDLMKKDHSAQKVTAEQIFVVTNFVLEIPAAVFDQLSSINKTPFALLSMLMSITTMLICIAELIYKGREGKVSWKWKERVPWFYYPSPSYKPFGSLNDIIGLLCAFFECVFVIIEYALYCRHIINPVRISSWPLIFSFCLLCSKFQKESQKKTSFTKD